MKVTCPVCQGDGRDEGVRLGNYPIVACTSCTLRFAPSAFHVPVDYERIYESPEYVATQVKPIEADFDVAAFVQHATYKAFFDQVKPFPGSKLLDVGCGVGRFCHAAHRLGWQTTGIDVSEKAIRIGQQRAPFTLQHATAQDLLGNRERFEVVTAFEVLEHLSQPMELLQQMRQLTGSRGTVFCTVPNWECTPVKTATRLDWIPPVHLCFFTRAALQRLGELAGFARVRTGTIWTDPMPGRPRAWLNWLRRRIRRQPRDPLGLWLLARE